MFSVYELLVFPPRNLDIPRVGHHDVVTAIHCITIKPDSIQRYSTTPLTTFVIYRLVLAHEHKRDPFGKFS